MSEDMNTLWRLAILIIVLIAFVMVISPSSSEEMERCQVIHSKETCIHSLYR